MLEAAGVVDPVALAGVQDKASARMLTVPVGRAGDRYILKIDPPGYQHLVVNENYFLSKARAGHVPVVEAEVVHDSTGRPGLLVRRFDRTTDSGGTATALAVEDDAQVLGLYPADKCNVTAEQVVDGVARLSAARAIAARAVFQQLCYAWLTGNGDLHAKNVSIVGAPTGEWRVAPAYTTCRQRCRTATTPWLFRWEESGPACRAGSSSLSPSASGGPLAPPPARSTTSSPSPKTSRKR